MARFVQGVGTRGSLKWIQLATNNHPHLLDAELARAFGTLTTVEWLSPVASDDYAEYRDAAFLDRLGLSHLAPALAEFWPKAGPQWDGLAKTADGRILLVEAKAHIREMCSPGSQASSPVSAALIDASLSKTAEHLRAKPLAPWGSAFYQLANRLAHLYFLRSNGVDAHLVRDFGPPKGGSRRSRSPALATAAPLQGSRTESPAVPQQCGLALRVTPTHRPQCTGKCGGQVRAAAQLLVPRF